MLMSSPADKEHISDQELLAASTVPNLVMAEQITHDVVKEAQSVGGISPIDDSASTTHTSAGNGKAPSGPPTLDSQPSDDRSITDATNDAAVGDTQQSPETADVDAVSIDWRAKMLWERTDGRRPKQR
jgi:hypothetical protein